MYPIQPNQIAVKAKDVTRIDPTNNAHNIRTIAFRMLFNIKNMCKSTYFFSNKDAIHKIMITLVLK